MKQVNKRIFALNIILLISIGFFLNPITKSISINEERNVDKFCNKNFKSTELGRIGNRIIFAHIELTIFPNTTTKFSWRYRSENPPILIGLWINTDGDSGEIDQAVARLKVNSFANNFESIYRNDFDASILFISGTDEDVEVPTDNDGFYMEGYCFLINIS